MALKQISLLLLVIGFVSAQIYRVCIPSIDRSLCNSLDWIGWVSNQPPPPWASQVACEIVESRVDCAIKLARGTADFGIFNEEETILLGLQQPNDNIRVIATIRDVSWTEPFSFEAVAVVPNSHIGGLDGLRGARYCHPGFDQSDQRWSPRVSRTFEQVVARTDRCPDLAKAGKTAEELEVETLNAFFTAACRPGPWSANTTIDHTLKRKFPNLCSLCGPTNPTCVGYTIDMGVADEGVRNFNRHIQALECLRANSNGSVGVAYVAWQHVRVFFSVRYPEAATSFAVLCPDGTTRALTSEIINNPTAPCAFVRQPWGTIVATAESAAAIQTNLRNWWPNGAIPEGNTWKSILFDGLIGGWNARVTIEEIMTPANYTSGIRNLSSIDATSTCLPARHWCTVSVAEQTKCTWVSNAALVLGIQPSIICNKRANAFECLKDIKHDRADFMSSSSNYGYLARQHYQLAPVKLVQNSRRANAFSRVAAFVKESSIAEIRSFENLRGMKACFPEFGGIAFVSFLRAARRHGVISASECDYARAVGEFFTGACAPGARDTLHALSVDSSFNSSYLCSLCRHASTIVGSDFTCSWDYGSNMFFGNNGSLACLADPSSDVAFLEIQNIEANLRELNLQGSQFRALCRNNTLAETAGVNIDDNCLLAHVVDAEVITKRNHPLNNALSVLLETLDLYFGYVAGASTQLINLKIFAPFDGISDLLFKDNAIGLIEPKDLTTNWMAGNYIELFQDLESCTGAAPTSSNYTVAPTAVVSRASSNFYSIIMLIVMAFM